MSNYRCQIKEKARIFPSVIVSDGLVVLQVHFTGTFMVYFVPFLRNGNGKLLQIHDHINPVVKH